MTPGCSTRCFRSGLSCSGSCESNAGQAPRAAHAGGQVAIRCELHKPNPYEMASRGASVRNKYDLAVN